MRTTGIVGWTGLTVYIVAWDRYANETLSASFGRALLHRQARLPTVAVWLVVTGHLFGVIPKQYDPIHKLGRVILRKPTLKVVPLVQAGEVPWI